MSIYYHTPKQNNGVYVIWSKAKSLKEIALKLSERHDDIVVTIGKRSGRRGNSPIMPTKKYLLLDGKMLPVKQNYLQDELARLLPAN